MIVDNHWNIDFLLNNPGFQLQDKIYTHTNEHIVIYYTEDIGYYHMYDFVMDNYIVDDIPRYGSCYFCEDESNNLYSFIKYIDSYTRYCCKTCAARWKVIKNNMKINGNLYSFDNSNNPCKLKPDAFTKSLGIFIMYAVLYTPKDKFNYKSIMNSLQKYHSIRQIPYNAESTSECDLCTGIIDDEEGDRYSLYVCDKCVDYAKQIIIEDNYEKYMLHNYLFDIHDVNFYLFTFFIPLLL
jgi:hypothetical protein